MFKWACLGVAVVFLSLFAWLLNDIRLQIRRSSGTMRTAAETVNEHLPEIVAKSRATTNTLAKNLPEIVEKAHTTTETLADLAADIRQLKELAGVISPARDKNLVAFADSLLALVESSGGIIGLKKKVFGSGLKSTQPAKEWAVGARKEALLLTVLVRSRKEMLTRLAKNKFGSDWYIQFGDQEPITLLQWIKDHHPDSKDL
jgi:ABC-type transporter Mla subunit MlaD